MINTDDPVLVRREVRQETTAALGPGVHSHNRHRHSPEESSAVPWLRILQVFLLIAGLTGTGYYLYKLGDQYIYQKYENWAFDQQINGRAGVTFTDFVRERTPIRLLVGARRADTNPQPASDGKTVGPSTGSLLGRVTISRLNLSAIVREGVDDRTLSTAVGHVPSTSLAGEPGNFAIAAHRDTLFRALKDIQKDDVITFESAQRTYKYQVAATRIVKPSDVSVLRPDGGNVMSDRHQDDRLLTMITCYPFYFVGSAPNRFIVEAKLIPEASSLATAVQPEEKTTSFMAVPLASKSREISLRRTHKRRPAGHRFWHR